MRALVCYALMAVCVSGLHAQVADADIEEALKTWRRYQMPEPPKDGVLVLLGSKGVSIVNGVRQPQRSYLAFRLPTPEGSKDRRYFIGTVVDVNPYSRVESPLEKPADLDADRVEVGPFGYVNDAFDVNQAFAMGMHVWAWGHKELGRGIVQRALKEDAGHHLSSFYQPAAESPQKMVPKVMWAHWANQLVEPDSDRRVLLQLMTKAHSEFANLKVGSESKDRNKAVLDGLEKAVSPVDAKPGTVEADVAALTDVCNKAIRLNTDRSHDPRYKALLLRGFEAVPALIEHLDDQRLTRSVNVGFNNFPSYIRRVGELASDLLMAIGGSMFNSDWLARQKGYVVDKEAVRKWFQEAQKEGEEKYLSSNLLTQEGEFIHDTLLIVSAKYPKVLLDKYRQALKEKNKHAEPLIDALVDCALSDEEKTQALKEGAASTDLRIRWCALRGLQPLDDKAASALIVKTLDSFGEKASGSEFWTTPEASYSHLALRTDSKEVWDALLRAAKRSEVGLRLQYMRPMNYTYVGDNLVDQRLRFLAAFMDDKTLRDGEDDSPRYVGPHATFMWSSISVRDFAADLAGSILDLEDEPDPDWDEEKWAPYRARVRAALKARGIEPAGND